MSGNTIGEGGFVTYVAGESPWSHTSGLQAIDDLISDLMHGKLRDEIVWTDVGDSTPSLIENSVDGTGVIRFNHASGTNITDFDDGVDEQFLVITADTANTTIVHDGTNIDLYAGTNITLAVNQYLCLRLEGTTWREVWNSIAIIGSGQIAAGAVGQTQIASSSVGAGELKITQTAGREVNVNPSIDVSLGATGVLYHWPEAYPENNIDATIVPLCDNSNYQTYPGSMAGTYFRITPDTAPLSVNWSFSYHQACPPHYLNGIEWGSFVFAIRSKSSGEITSSWMSQDPPWYYDAGLWPKGHKNRIAAMPHPFMRRELTEDQEIVLIDTREYDLAEVCCCENLLRFHEFTKLRLSEKDPEKAVELFRESQEMLRCGDESKKAKMMDVLAIKARLFGSDTWSQVSELPHITGATNQLVIDGKPFTLGVPEFDDVVTIVTAG